MNAMLRRFNTALISLVAATAFAAPSNTGTVPAFPPLFQVVGVSGKCLIRYPGVDEFEMAVESRAYPYGCTLQTGENSEMMVIFGTGASVSIGASSLLSVENSPETKAEAPAIVPEEAPAEVDAGAVSLDDLAEVDAVEEEDVSSKIAESSEPPKIVKLELGTVVFGLPRAAEDSVYLPIMLETALGKFDRIQFNPSFTVSKTQEANVLQIKSQRGDFRYTGEQCWSDKIKTLSVLDITTAFDKSFTHIDCSRGEFAFTLECGSDEPVVAEVRPGSRIKIWRKVAGVTKRLAVSMVIEAADGNISSSFAFLQGDRPIIGSLKPWNAQDEDAKENTAEQNDIFGADSFGDDSGFGSSDFSDGAESSDDSASDDFGGDFSF